METTVLYNEFRPRRFSQLVGQQPAVEVLSSALAAGRVGHAYLFSGPRGCGKTSSARILAAALNCERRVGFEPCGQCDSCLLCERGAHPDVIELDAASNNGVDAMRTLLSSVPLSAFRGQFKIYVIDEAHMLTAQASNALLKTLEEPPGHVVFVLATTSPRSMLPTILSRALHVKFRLVAADTLREHVGSVAAAAGLSVSDDALSSAVARSGGSVRDALSALEVVSQLSAQQLDDPAVAVVEALAAGDLRATLLAVAAGCREVGSARALCEQLLALLRDMFLAHWGAVDLLEVSDPAVAADLAARLTVPKVTLALDCVSRALVSSRGDGDARVALDAQLLQGFFPRT